jgi:NAD(P)-dependent dehydrogenase (short-subunit alcohol dehydrogenase family)
MPGRMAGRVALVTGGGGGIGEATGRLFAEEGAAVALLDTDAAAVAAAAAGIQAAIPGAQVMALAGDVTREAEARRIIDDTAARWGALHTLVNVAGVRVYAPLADADAADWERIIGVNVLGTAHCCKAALPRLRASGRGTIVNVSSVWGHGPDRHGPVRHLQAAVLGFRAGGGGGSAPYPGQRGVPGRHHHALSHPPRGGARGLRGGDAHAARGRQPARALGGAARGGVSDPVPRRGRVVLRHGRHPDGGRRALHLVTASGAAARLRSVDALRGLTVAAMVLVNNPGTWSAVYAPLRHAAWHGWTPTDMVFPFFLFVVGVAIALAWGRRSAETPGCPRASGARR